MHLLFFHVRKATGGESACLIIVLPDKQNPPKMPDIYPYQKTRRLWQKSHLQTAGGIKFVCSSLYIKLFQKLVNRKRL